MHIRIKKWGNSLGVRIPKNFANNLSLKDGTIVEMKENDGEIIIYPVKDDLSDILSRINESNIHCEYETGKPEGKEIW
ncbi:MAG TPA: AbrB/MazE/SpoVT family DNA-binding domain-containing protein [Spirochaetota bacterium]|nr:AbrB/MazE/SpoVT family DNA-binding domain-containing protein [Spirochaetota bacterium]